LREGGGSELFIDLSCDVEGNQWFICCGRRLSVESKIWILIGGAHGGDLDL